MASRKGRKEQVSEKNARKGRERRGRRKIGKKPRGPLMIYRRKVEEGTKRGRVGPECLK